MQNEKVIDLPPVLFKSAGEAWGNDDNLWLRENGMADNLFMVDNSMEGETAIFKTGGQAWVITRAEKVFAKTIACKHISNKLNILSAQSDILGNPGWSDREVLTFLIGQIVQMPTIDCEALARDVFVDGNVRCRGLFGKISNSSISGAIGNPNFTFTSTGTREPDLSLTELYDSITEPGMRPVNWDDVKTPMSNYFQPGGIFNSCDRQSSQEEIDRAVAFLTGLNQKRGEQKTQEVTGAAENPTGFVLFNRMWKEFSNDTDDTNADFIIGIDPGQPDSGATITHLNYSRGKHRDYKDGAVERNKYMTYGPVMKSVDDHRDFFNIWTADRELFEIEKGAGKTPSPDNISEEKTTFYDAAKFHYSTLSGKTLFEHLQRHQGVTLDLEGSDVTVSLNTPDADDLREVSDMVKLDLYRRLGLPSSFFGFGEVVSSEARSGAKDKLLKLGSSDLNDPHRLAEGYNGEAKSPMSDSLASDPLMNFITRYYSDSFIGDDSEHLRKLKSGKRPFALTDPTMVKLDITDLEDKNLLASIKDTVKDGEVRSESERYLTERANKAKE